MFTIKNIENTIIINKSKFITNLFSVDNIDEILSSCAGIMIGRGDLGVEIAFEKLPKIQKYLIDKSLTLEYIEGISINHKSDTNINISNQILKYVDLLIKEGLL